MRIISGKYRGKSLLYPKDPALRPTQDRVKEAMFGIVQFQVPDAVVLDLFCGTGSLGIEALSCGAKFCLFVDDDAESRALVRENVETMKLTGVSKIWRRDAADLGPLGSGSGGPFNLAFIDPPYRKRLADKCLASLKAGGWLAPGAIVVVETAADETLDHAGYELLDTRAYGETSVRLLSPAE